MREEKPQASSLKPQASSLKPQASFKVVREHSFDTKKIAVIGAGPAGLSVALQLVRAGHKVEIFEAESALGGMSRSFPLWGQIVDLGPHRFFSMDSKINGFWKEQIGEDYLLIERLTRIFYDKKFFLYPIKAFDALSKLGLWEAFLCGCSYLTAQLRKRGSETTFEQWVSNRFGYRLYSIFFKSYSERLWGIPCTMLDADFASQRIKGLNLWEVAKSAIFSASTKKHKTLVDQFAYPKLGCGQVYEKLAAQFRHLGGKIHLSKPVKRIVVETRDSKNVAMGIELESGEVITADHIISTAPFTDMILNIPQLEAAHTAARGLTYRNTTLVYLQVKQQDIFKDNWIYVHEKKLQTGRISNFRNWSPAMLNGREEAILCLEYWSYDEDSLWTMPDADLIRLAIKEIIESGLVKPEAIATETPLDEVGHVVRMHRSYPVYARDYNEKLKVLQAAADTISGVTFIGRNGSFKYNNQDHSILMGLLAAENIASGTAHNLWSVNTDYDYQEGKSDIIEENKSKKE